MNQQQLLSQLKDIHAPKSISMWPATLAWYVLFGLIIFILVYLAIKAFHIYAKKIRQRTILKLLAEAVALYQTNPALSLANISILLRRIALAKYQRNEVASLHNIAWLNFLDQQIQTTEFSQGIGQVLLTAPYQRSVNVDINCLAQLVERWIRKI